MSAVTAESNSLIMTDFINEIVKQMRALDSHGIYDSQSVEQLLAPFVISKQQRRQIPLIGDPSQAIVSRLQAFYNAIAILIEKQGELMAVPMINLTSEGFGRVIITVGKLLVLDRTLRDAHRFGFVSIEKMQAEAEKLVSVALALINQYPEVARL